MKVKIILFTLIISHTSLSLRAQTMNETLAYAEDITRMQPSGAVHHIYIPVKQYHQSEEVVLSHREGEAGKITEENLKGEGTRFTLRCTGETGKEKADLVVEANTNEYTTRNQRDTLTILALFLPSGAKSPWSSIKRLILPVSLRFIPCLPRLMVSVRS